MDDLPAPRAEQQITEIELVDDTAVQGVEHVADHSGNDRLNKYTLFRFLTYYIFLPIFMIFAALEGPFFYIVNQRKALLIIFIALIVLVPSITIYFTIFRHHPRSSPIQTQVSNANIYQFDIREDYLSYNITFFFRYIKLL